MEPTVRKRVRASGAMVSFFDLHVTEAFYLIQMQSSVIGSIKPESFPKLLYITDQILTSIFQLKINRLRSGNSEPCRNPGEIAEQRGRIESFVKSSSIGDEATQLIFHFFIRTKAR